MKEQTICTVCNNRSEAIKLVMSEIKIKGKQIVLEAPRKICTECHEIKFDQELDQAFAVHAIKKYNELYGISGQELVALRKTFGISQDTLGKVLGIAKKTIVAYENETSIPNDSYHTLLKSLIADKTKLFDYASINKDKLSAYESKKIFEQGPQLMDFSCDPFHKVISEEATPYNGYQVSHKENVMQVIQYVASRVKGKTKLAKTLFFADAIAYAETASSLTGLYYAAINNGPIPDQFDSILEYMVKRGKLHLEIQEVHDYTQYNYHATTDGEVDEGQATYLNKAIAFTLSKTAAQLSELTHKLDMWREAKTGEKMTFDLLGRFSLDTLIES